MTTPIFEVIETPPEMQQDDAPLTTETVGEEYPDKCLTCGKGVPYGGAGRRPKYCDEHKKTRAKSSPRASGRGDAKLAANAARMLGQLNGLIGMGLAAYGLDMTAAAIAKAEEQFVESATTALENDPKLARKITSLGASTGKASLAVAYGMLGAAIAPVAVVELRMKKAAQEEASDV